MCLFSTTKTNKDIDAWDEPRPHRSYYSADPRGSARKASLPASASYTSVDRYTEYDRSHRGGASSSSNYGERDDYRRSSRQRQRSSVRSIRDYRDSRDRYDYEERDTVNVRRYSRVEREYSPSRSRSRTRSRSRSRAVPIRRAKSRHRSQSRPAGPINIVRVDRNPSRKRSTRHRRSTSISKVEIIRPEEHYTPRSPRVVRAIMPASVLVEPATTRIVTEQPYVRTIPSQPNISRVFPTAHTTPAVLRPYTPAAVAAEATDNFIPVGEVERLEDVGTFAGIEVDKVKREVVGYPRYEIRAPRY